jgi:hypothetical protein
MGPWDNDRAFCSIERRGTDPQSNVPQSMGTPMGSGSQTQNGQNLGSSRSGQIQSNQSNIQRSDTNLKNQTGLREQTDVNATVDANAQNRSNTRLNVDANGTTRDRVVFDANSFSRLGNVGINFNTIDRSRLVEEGARAVHVGCRNVGIPVRHGAESGPGMEVHASQAERRRAALLHQVTGQHDVRVADADDRVTGRVAATGVDQLDLPVA